MRPEEPDALFHITARAIRTEPLFRDDRDRCLFLLTLSEVVEWTGWRCLTYCLMTTHYHLVVETPAPNLAVGMQRLNGRYAEGSNTRHGERGHAFGARYWSEPLRRESHLLEAMRYVPLNPVRAGLVAAAGEWRWSAHRLLVDEDAPPSWVDADRAVGYFGGRARYAEFVEDGSSTGRTSAR